MLKKNAKDPNVNFTLHSLSTFKNILQSLKNI